MNLESTQNQPFINVFRQLSKITTDAVFLLDTEGQLLFANSHLKKLFGYQEEEKLAVSFFSLFPKNQKELLKEKTAKVLKEDFTDSFSIEILKKDRTVLPVIITLSRAIHDGYTFIQGSIKATESIATNAVNEQDKIYKKLVDVNASGIIIFQDEKIVFANEMATKITGYTK